MNPVSNVVNLIVKEDYCIGCGVCAGVCPSNNLHMDWSNKGELIPYSNGLCKANCTLCLDVCPFNNHDINQDDISRDLFSNIPKIRHDKDTGHYLNCYVGFQRNVKKRLKSASGGLATSFLSTILEDHVVDRVISVCKTGTKDRMFEFKILKTSKEVYSCAGSAYYPVEISKILKEILKENTENTYAIIVLPCIAFALRLAMRKIPKLKRKIKIIASLTCGQLQNQFYSELLALESGIKVTDLSIIDFRRKSRENYATNFLQIAIDKQGKEGIPQANHKLPFHLWHYHYFKQNSCNYCDDIFGETADITFMDAWLPKYIEDYKGTSLIIVRTEILSNLFKNRINEKCILDDINIEKIKKSQSTLITKKRELISGKIYKTEKLGLWHPKKRVTPNKEIYLANKKFFDITTKIQEESKNIWPKLRLNSSTRKFWKHFKKIEFQIKTIETKKNIKLYLKKLNNLFKKII